MRGEGTTPLSCPTGEGLGVRKGDVQNPARKNLAEVETTIRHREDGGGEVQLGQDRFQIPLRGEAAQATRTGLIATTVEARSPGGEAGQFKHPDRPIRPLGHVNRHVEIAQDGALVAVLVNSDQLATPFGVWTSAGQGDIVFLPNTGNPGRDRINRV